MIALLKESVLAMKQTNTLMARLQNDMYPTQPFIPQNNNSAKD